MTTTPARRVVWEDGMHLTPQHFQAQRRYQEDQARQTIDLVFPFSYGLSAVEIDADALHNGSLALVHARGVLPDRTAVQVPEGDPLPDAVRIADRFSPARDAQVVYLALPRWRADAANVADDASVSGVGERPRFRVLEDVLADEATGMDPLPVRFAARNFQLYFDDEVTDAMVAMPIARIRRDGLGQFQLDTTFVPPVLQISASARLLALTHQTLDLLAAKASALGATVSSAPLGAAGGAAAYAGNELATRWLLHAVRSAEAPLRHMLLTRRAHPERLYLELARLAGALCTFSMTAHPVHLPAYAHEDLTTCFEQLEQHLRAHLDVVVSSRVMALPLQQTTDVLHQGAVVDPRCFEPGARWFLAVRSQIPAGDLIDRVVRLTKTCSAQFVLELVRRAYPGLTTVHCPAPPAALAPRPDLVYFELTMDGPCAQAITTSRDVGVYVPDAIPGAYLELAVLLPSS